MKTNTTAFFKYLDFQFRKRVKEISVTVLLSAIPGVLLAILCAAAQRSQLLFIPLNLLKFLNIHA